MDEQTILGIDPGMSGGMAIIGIDSGQIIQVEKFKDKTLHDIAEVMDEWKEGFEIKLAMLELVHSMPKQGVSSTFKFGTSYGFLMGLLTALKVPYEQVTPQKWQKFLSCQSGGNKNVTKAKAQELWPAEKITHAIADAMLIAEYGRRTVK